MGRLLFTDRAHKRTDQAGGTLMMAAALRSCYTVRIKAT